MERISVDLGRFVLTGGPAAVMGGEALAAALIAVGFSQPILYIEFRKDGIPVDPGPSWATNGKKVRGSCARLPWCSSVQRQAPH
jgi:septal ring factor EnvC (AmiA/AmiB activator)